MHLSPLTFQSFLHGDVVIGCFFLRLHARRVYWGGREMGCADLCRGIAGFSLIFYIGFIIRCIGDVFT